MGAESLGVVSGAITIPFRSNGASAPFGKNKQINLGDKPHHRVDATMKPEASAPIKLENQIKVDFDGCICEVDMNRSSLCCTYKVRNPRTVRHPPEGSGKPPLLLI